MSCSDSFSRCCLLPVSNRKRMAISLAVSRQARNSPDTFFFSPFFKAPAAVSAGAFPSLPPRPPRPRSASQRRRGPRGAPAALTGTGRPPNAVTGITLGGGGPRHRQPAPHRGERDTERPGTAEGLRPEEGHGAPRDPRRLLPGPAAPHPPASAPHTNTHGPCPHLHPQLPGGSGAPGETFHRGGGPCGGGSPLGHPGPRLPPPVSLPPRFPGPTPGQDPWAPRPRAGLRAPSRGVRKPHLPPAGCPRCCHPTSGLPFSCPQPPELCGSRGGRSSTCTYPADEGLFRSLLVV